MMQRMTASEKRLLAIACLVAAFMIGWLPFAFRSSNLFYVLMLGAIGTFPFLLINGVHGDMEGIRGFVGCVLFVVINAGIYYGISSFILKRIRARKQKKDAA
jgi:hypothetical protein